MGEKALQLSLDNDLFYPEIKPSFLVNQSPVLINMRQNLNITERRIVFSLIALVQPDHKDFKSYVIRAQDLADLAGIGGQSFYNRIESAIDSLMKKQLVIESDNGKIVDKIQWVQRATYFKNKGLIRIKLSDDLKAYLLGLQRYTKYRLMYVLPLRSEYSWRIYELLKEEAWKTTKQITYKDEEYKSYRIITVQELRRLLDIPDDQYTLMKHFRTSVLNLAMKEIAQKTDIAFSYDVHKKRGRSIESFIFYIKDNKKNIAKQLDVDIQRNDIESILNHLILCGVRRDAAVKAIEDYTLDYIDATLRHALSKKDAKELRSLPGYLIKALQDNYAKYEGTIKKEKDTQRNEINSFNNMILTNLDNQYAELNKRDIEQLVLAFKTHNERLLTTKTSSQEELDKLDQQGKELIFKRIEAIQTNRMKNKLAPLLVDDFPTNSRLRKIFEEWEQKEDF